MCDSGNCLPASYHFKSKSYEAACSCKKIVFLARIWGDFVAKSRIQKLWLYDSNYINQSSDLQIIPFSTEYKSSDFSWITQHDFDL